MVSPNVNRPVEPKANSSSSSASSSSVEKGKPFSYTPEFEELWKIYPRRDGSKWDAFERYQSAIKKGTEHGRIIEGLRAFRQYIERNGLEKRFIPHGSTWLNERRWESEYSDELPLLNGRAGTARPNSNYERAKIAVQQAAITGGYAPKPE